MSDTVLGYPIDNDDLILGVKEAVAQYYKDCYAADKVISIDDINIVWFAKTLQNFKALACTKLVDQSYFEVTYDGIRDLVYVDSYTKVDQIKIENYEDYCKNGYTRQILKETD